MESTKTRIYFEDGYSTDLLSRKDAYRISKTGNIKKLDILFGKETINIDFLNGSFYLNGKLMKKGISGKKKFICFEMKYRSVPLKKGIPNKFIGFPVFGYQITEDNNSKKLMLVLDPYIGKIYFFNKEPELFEGQFGNGRLSAYYDIFGEIK